MLKTLEKLKKDPRVVDAWSETTTDDGYWVNLKPGYHCKDYGGEVHQVHEWNIADLLRAFRSVEPCSCEDCKKILPK